MNMVRCVDHKGCEKYLTAGKEYRVIADEKSSLLVHCDDGENGWFLKSRFDHIGESESKSIESIANEIGKLVQEKNDAYGNSFAKSGEFLKLLYPDGIKPEQYRDMLLVVRIFDKQMRIANKKGTFGESPYRDITGYGILGALVDETEK